jgi:sugar/nucleoside kinase (ribokinase family)
VIVGLGNALVDVLARTEMEAVARHGLTPGGMHLVEADAAEALYGEVGPGRRQSGGSVANTVAHLAHEGVRPAFVGKVGADDLGDAFAGEFEDLDIHFATDRADGVGTGRCVVLVTPDGERTMSTYLGAAITLGPPDVAAAMPDRADLLLVEGYLWDSPEGAATIAEATARAKRAGAAVAFTPSDSLCVERNRAEMLAFLEASCDVLVGNEAEVGALAGTGEDAKAGLAWARERVGTAAVTMSEAGSLVSDGNGTEFVPAEAVPRVVDTTGAGDAYAAGLLAGLARGQAVTQAARRGATIAARVVQHTGAREGAAAADPAA